MNPKKKHLLKLILLLFTLSVSAAIVPGTFVNTYGLLGEVTAVSVCEQNTSVMETSIPHSVKALKKVAVSTAYNLWFVILPILLILRYTQYQLRLPRYQTIVTLKVRMDR